jgi:hypothetical protein
MTAAGQSVRTSSPKQPLTWLTLSPDVYVEVFNIQGSNSTALWILENRFSEKESQRGHKSVRIFRPGCRAQPIPMEFAAYSRSYSSVSQLHGRAQTRLTPSLPQLATCRTTEEHRSYMSSSFYCTTKQYIAPTTRLSLPDPCTTTVENQIRI